MEPNFQTSFIPKKPMLEQRVVEKKSINILLIVAIFIFLTVIVASGGLYFYKTTLTQNLKRMGSDLDLAKNRFESAKIGELKLLDKRLNAANEILGKHISISPIFELLEGITMKTVRYNNFGYSLDGKGGIAVSMSGQAIGYRSIALQADLFSKNKNIIDPLFSNLSLDEKGNVLFNLTFSVNSNFVNYKQTEKLKGGEALSVTNDTINPATIN